ncbi:MAG: UTP--glucose-1-phosphate uridylyltransferase [Candidatus Altiarchaeales archaeon]|nr:MAG: UTP--glucose-1-phosphate uridylyltransferase [Candidatus Altiarchaeales archaeon ex4484_43]RLI88105.1 MAG: UTP--glucose-1-phosphate uridylyltransferase [Candidatus Altiarchaeales archaeon]HDI73061.1 UTP--glucose-1-phosphate uridylyltransferase GalU [Candidatus Altiarchaeales archaeon]
MKAVIPAAGLGTRFLPATKAQPKEMLPIVDKPTIQFVVEEAINSGIDDILIITGRGKRAIEDHFDRSFELEEALKEQGKTDLLKEVVDISELADIHYLRQKERKGLGHAIYCARNHVGDEPFAVLLGDTIVESEIPCTKQLMNFYQKYEGSMIAVEEVQEEKISSYGIIDPEVIDDNDNNVYLVKNLVEKPKVEEAPSNLGIIGRYILTPAIFDILEKTKPGKGNEIQLTDALNTLRKKKKVYACKFSGKRYDIGNKLDYLKTCIEYGLENREIGEKLWEYLRNLSISDLND